MSLPDVAASGDAAAVAELLGAAPDPEDVRQALRRAAGAGRTAVIQLLHDAAPAGVDLPLDNALIVAARAGHVSAVDLLLDLGASAGECNQYGWTALLLAAQDGQVDAAKALLRRGADPTACTRDGRSALHFAAKRGDAELVPVLHAAGCSLDGRAAMQRTPLMFAAREGHADTVEALLRAGCSPNEIGDGGFPVLCQAVQAAHVACAEALLAAGADPNALAADGSTALALTAHCKRELRVELVDFLLAAGAAAPADDAFAQGRVLRFQRVAERQFWVMAASKMASHWQRHLVRLVGDFL